MGRKITDTARVRANAATAWAALLNALDTTSAACADDDRYVSEASDLEPGDREVMGEICNACPILTRCSAYAAADLPAGAWWPGHNLTTTSRPENTNQQRNHYAALRPHRI